MSREKVWSHGDCGGSEGGSFDLDKERGPTLDQRGYQTGPDFIIVNGYPRPCVLTSLTSLCLGLDGNQISPYRLSLLVLNPVTLVFTLVLSKCLLKVRSLYQESSDHQYPPVSPLFLRLTFCSLKKRRRRRRGRRRK